MEKTAREVRRYTVGDTIELRVAVTHTANLREMRMIFTHEDSDAYLIGKGATPRISASHDRVTDGPVSSVVEVEILLQRGVSPGIYELTRISYETVGGQLGHLGDWRASEGARVAFEVVREPRDTPEVLDVAFADE